MIEQLFGVNRRKAFRKLVVNSRGRLYRMAYAWTSDPQLADDLVQQATYKALSNQKQLRDLAAGEAWLFRILANCLTDYRRAKREFFSDDTLELVDKRTPEHEAEEQLLVRKVRKAVGLLPDNQRQVVTLVDLEGFAYATVAQILEIPVGTVMSRLCRGRRALKEHLMEIRPGSSDEQVVKMKRVK
jgi:RNA polymerase sigma-70 factor (ECF subfamily)